MNELDKNGGPAFPGWHDERREWGGGMSLRDFFAAKAMQSFAAHSVRENFHWDKGEIAAQTCAAYVWADAMLAERERGDDE